MDLQPIREQFQTLKKALKSIRLEVDEPDIKVATSEVYRFYWLRRHQQSSIIISLYLDSSGERGNLVFKEISQSFWNKPFTIDKTFEKPVEKESVLRLQSHVANMHFFTFPEVDAFMGLDGSSWVFEAANEGKYHIATRWCPFLKESLHDFANCGLLLLLFSGIDLHDDRYRPY